MIGLINTIIYYTKMRWLISCLIFFCVACSNKQQQNNVSVIIADSLKENRRITNAFLKIDSAKKIITTGDLIVRTGNDFTSESLRSLNQRDKTYSHCGIVSIENDTVFVYHALGGEWNPNQRIRRDVLTAFAEPFGNRGIGVYRYSISAQAINSLIITTKKLYEIGVMFDMKFDLNSQDRMYCAEFVYKAYVMGTKGKLKFNVSHIGDFVFIGVDDLFMQPLCHLQKKILY